MNAQNGGAGVHRKCMEDQDLSTSCLCVGQCRTSELRTSSPYCLPARSAQGVLAEPEGGAAHFHQRAALRGAGVGPAFLKPRVHRWDDVGRRWKCGQFCTLRKPCSHFRLPPPPGIDRTRVEDMEVRLKADILAEARMFGNQILVQDENADL